MAGNPGSPARTDLDYEDMNIALRRMEKGVETLWAAEQDVRIALGMVGYDRTPLDHIVAARTALGPMVDALKKEVESHA